MQRGQRLLELLLFLIELLVLRFHAVDLRLGRGLALQRLAREVLLAERQRCLGLILQVISRMLELLLLQLDLLARRGDGNEGLADLGEVVEHLLIRQIEHLVGLLRGVERLVGLGRDDVVRSLEQGHLGCS